MKGRKYLDYDLESLHVFLNQQQQARRVVVAFQDSEAFESGLLTDLVTLFQYDPLKKFYANGGLPKLTRWQFLARSHTL